MTENQENENFLPIKKVTAESMEIELNKRKLCLNYGHEESNLTTILAIISIFLSTICTFYFKNLPMTSYLIIIPSCIMLIISENLKQIKKLCGCGGVGKNER